MRPFNFLFCLFFLTQLQAADGLLEIHTINVQQGNCTLVIGPGDIMVLLDSGRSQKGNNEIIPYLKSIGLPPPKGLDYTISSHLDSDHIGGLDELIDAGYDVKKANYFNGSEKSNSYITTYKNHCASTTAGGPEPVSPGMRIDLGQGAYIEILASNGALDKVGDLGIDPDEENDLSIALLVKYGNFEYVWAGDLGWVIENPLAILATLIEGSPLPPTEGVDVLAISHHGSESSTGCAWMNLLKPEVALISVGDGQGGSYNHPRINVVDGILLAGNPCVTVDPALVLQTEEGNPVGDNTSFSGFAVGDIVIKTDGEETYSISGSGAVTQGPDERSAAGLPLTVDVDWKPRYNLYFAQFGNGSGVKSDLVLTNTSSKTATVSVEFRDDNGDPLLVGVSDLAEHSRSQQSSLELSIPPLETVTISTDGSGELVVGSAEVISNVILGGVIRFTLPGLGIAGVGSSKPYSSFAIPVRAAGGVNTGLAFFNPGEQPVDISFTYKGVGGTSESVEMKSFPKHGHSAKFLSEIFKGSDLGEAMGTLIVRVTGGEIAAIALEVGSFPGEFTTLPVTEVK